ncbi:MAG: S41 family peptidase [Bacteroidaceae bacterium]|nr:S41 family peptidase [Bacteroidaceae bacterium]
MSATFRYIRERYKSFLKVLFATACTLLLGSCVSEEQFEDTPQGNFEALWKIIDEHYCFLTYKKDTLGLDWDEVHTRYSNRLSTDMNRSQLFEVLADMLSELRDGHVNLYAAHDLSRYWSWYEDYPSNFNQDLQDEYLGKSYLIASSLQYRILEDNIGYVVCQSFSSGLGDGNISEVLNYLRLCNGIIIDVRENGGGSLENAERLASHFTNESLLVGYLQHKTGIGHDDFSSMTAEYLEPSDGVRWQKNAIVLTNRHCYSATNAFVRDMKQCAKVTVLGDNTGGGSGMPFFSELPNGWSVRFSACPMFDADGNQIEFGIQPDINVQLDSADVASGHDTLIEAARRLLASHND